MAKVSCEGNAQDGRERDREDELSTQVAAGGPICPLLVRRIWDGEARYMQLYRHEMKIGALSGVREPAGGKGCFRVTSDPWDRWLGRPISGAGVLDWRASWGCWPSGRAKV